MNIQILLGSLMGDSCISKQGNTYFLSIEHSLKQEEYIRWKADRLKISNLYPRNRIDKRTGKINSSIQMRKGSKEFKPFYEAFYTPKKQISREILEELTPEAIAVWYCDDGNVYYNGNNCHITLCTNGFSDKSRITIMNWFRHTFGIKFKQTTQGAIRLTSIKECEKFMQLIEGYMPLCMRYKTLYECIKKYEEKLNTQQLKYRNGQLNKKV